MDFLRYNLKYRGYTGNYIRITVDEYIRRKIIHQMFLNRQKLLSLNPCVGQIVWCAFDKGKFDRKLKKQIRKLYNIELDIEPYWEMYFKFSNLYMQQGCLEDSYDYKFKSFGTNRDYGAIIFYARDVKCNPDASKELIRVWFYNVLYRKYIETFRWKRMLSSLSKKTFELRIRWSPIAEVAMHFDKTLSISAVREYITSLCQNEEVEIKTIDDCKIVLGKH